MKNKPTPPESSSIPNAEAEAPVRDSASQERRQEAEAFLEILAVSDREVDAGLVQPATEVVARLRKRYGPGRPGAAPHDPQSR